MHFTAVALVILLAAFPALAAPIEISGSEVKNVVGEAGQSLKQYIPNPADDPSVTETTKVEDAGVNCGTGRNIFDCLAMGDKYTMDTVQEKVATLPASLQPYGEQYYATLQDMRTYMPKMKKAKGPPRSVETFKRRFSNFIYLMNGYIPEVERDWVPSTNFNFEVDLANVIESLDLISEAQIQEATPTFQLFRRILDSAMKKQGLTPSTLTA